MVLALVHHFILPIPGLEHRAGLHHIAEAGRIGLDLFFVLSGFLITGILLDTRGQPHYFRNFYIRRGLRIVPLYFLLLVVLFLLLPPIYFRNPETAHLGRLWSRQSADWPWYFLYLPNILFLIRDGFAPSGLDVTWSLGVEEQYYLSWAVLVFLLSPRRLKGLCVGFVIGALLTRLVMFLLGASWIQIHVMILARMDALSLGGLIALLVRSPEYEPKSFARTGGRVALLALVALLAFLPLGSLRHDSAVTLLLGYTLVGLLCAGSMVAIMHAPRASLLSRIFTSPVLRFFGRYSYAIYLSHVLIRDELRRRWFPSSWFLEVDGLELIGRQSLFFLIATACSVVIALLSWNFFEKHWLGLKRLFPRFSTGRPAAVESAAEPLVSVK
jgi:peptidoglycan/LPS O-acetylase OafA/YrhL